MNKLFVFMVACLMLLAPQVESQILGKIKNKVKEKVNGTEETNSNNSTTNSSSNNGTNSTSQSIKKELKIEDKFAPVKDNGMTDEIHAKHLKEIVFSETALQSANKSYNIPSNAKEEILAKSFSLSDDIYFMAYFERSFYNQMMNDKKEMPENTYVTPRIWYEVNGKEAGKKGENKFMKNLGPYDVKEWTSLAFSNYSLTKCEDFNPENPQLSFYSYVLPLLQAGDNKVKMFVSFDVIKYNGNGGPEATMTEEERTVYSPAQPMAVGEMTLKVNNIADIKKMLTKSGYLPTAGQSNPALEKQIMTVYNANNSTDKAVKAIISDSDWTIRHNDLGVIIGRYMGVKVIATSPDPNYYVIWDKSVEQPYSGGGQYSSKIVLSNYTTPCYTVSASLFK
jgi:hypothetical protein